MTDLKQILIILNKNLLILQEREAKYAGDAPLGLINQIEDYRHAIDLTKQVLDGHMREAQWQEAMRPLNLGIEVTSPPSPIPLQRPARVTHFMGRSSELTQLLNELAPGKVVTLCGPGGIGKTALATEAIWTLAPGANPPDKFPDGIIFYSFYNQPQADSALEHIARSYGEEPRPTPRDAARRSLASRMTLLILDGSEAADDLNSVLDVRGNCGVLVTSRRRGDAKDGRRDIAPLPIEESVSLLCAWAGERAADHASVKHISEIVGGLPLAVRLVGRYLDETDQDAVDYLVWLKETPLHALGQGERQLESVPLLLERSLKQVSQVARQILTIIGLLAPAPFDREVIAAVLELPLAQITQRLGELVSYGLLRRTGSYYEVSHALIHTYARRRHFPSTEIRARMVAFYAMLTDQQSKLGVEGYIRLDLERVHVLAILAWCLEQEAWKVILDLVKGIDSYLEIQGHWTDRTTALKAGLNAAQQLNDQQSEAELLSKLGNSYRSLGQMKLAIESYEVGLIVARQVGARKWEGACLGNLGLTYRELGQPKRAVKCYEEALAIAKSINDQRYQSVWLGNLGNAYRDLGSITVAIEHLKQALVIACNIGDRREECYRTGSLGLAYEAQGNTGEAVRHYQQALEIAREIGDRRNEATWLGVLGNTYLNSGEVGQALEYSKGALELSREITNRRGESNSLATLGKIYYAKGQLDEAIDLLKQALIIAREIGYRRGESNHLGNLGQVCQAAGDVEQAISYVNQALELAQQINYPQGVRRQLSKLGHIYGLLGQPEQATDHYDQALKLAREMEDRDNQGKILKSLSQLQKNLGNVPLARQYLEEALAVFEKINSPNTEECHLLLRELCGD